MRLTMPGDLNRDGHTFRCRKRRLRIAGCYLLIALVAGNIAGEIAFGAVSVVVTNQTGSGSGLFAPSWNFAAGSLIAGTMPSTVGSGNFIQESAGGVAVLTDGAFGSISNGLTGSHPSFATCGPNGGTSVTYLLPGSATNGYDITNIVVYGGWNDSGRDQQGYTVSYSTAATPAVFIPLTTVNYNPSISSGVQSASRVTIASSTTSPLAINVALVKFDFSTVSVENGYTGYAELQIFGRPSNPPVANLPASLPGSSVYAGTNVTLIETPSGTALSSSNGSRTVAVAAACILIFRVLPAQTMWWLRVCWATAPLVTAYASLTRTTLPALVPPVLSL